MYKNLKLCYALNFKDFKIAFVRQIRLLKPSLPPDLVSQPLHHSIHSSLAGARDDFNLCIFDCGLFLKPLDPSGGYFYPKKVLYGL